MNDVGAFLCGTRTIGNGQSITFPFLRSSAKSPAHGTHNIITAIINTMSTTPSPMAPVENPACDSCSIARVCTPGEGGDGLSAAV